MAHTGTLIGALARRLMVALVLLAAATTAAWAAPTDQWFYVEAGERRGPVSEADLKVLISQGVVLADTLVWRQGLADWAPAETLPELGIQGATEPGPAADPAPTVEPEPATEPEPTVELEPAAPPRTWRRHSRSRAGADPPAPGEKEWVPRTGLIIGGSITFGLSWGLAVLTSAALGSACGGDNAGCQTVAGTLWVPVVGPLLSLASTDMNEEPILVVGMVAWSAIQVTGATLLTFGLIGTHRPAGVASAETPTWTVTPLLGKVNGLGFATSF